MQIIDLDRDFMNYLNTMGTVELRKLARDLGMKGFSSARGEAIRIAIRNAWETEQAAKAAAEAAAAPKVAVPGTSITALVVTDAEKAKLTPKKSNVCTDCGVRRISKAVRGTELCEICYDYAGWENTHNDDAHDYVQATPAEKRLPEQVQLIDGCPVCHPELDRRTPKPGRSRAGMVIVAKGTELHKSATFQAAAEAKGWKVQILGYVSDDEEQERYVATAARPTAAGDDFDIIELAWNGRAYDYPASSAHLNGKTRKVRNLKEALRLI